MKPVLLIGKSVLFNILVTCTASRNGFLFQTLLQRSPPHMSACVVFLSSVLYRLQQSLSKRFILAQGESNSLVIALDII